MLENLVPRYCHIDVMGDKKELFHTSYQCNSGLPVAISNEMLTS